MTSVGSCIQPSTIRSPSNSRTRTASAGGVATRSSQGSISRRTVHENLLGDVEARELEEALPFTDAVVPHVARVAQAVRFFRRLADEGVVADHDAAGGDARHLLQRTECVGEVMRGEPRRNGVEAAVGKGQMLRRRNHVGLHTGRGGRR